MIGLRLPLRHEGRDALEITLPQEWKGLKVPEVISMILNFDPVTNWMVDRNIAYQLQTHDRETRLYFSRKDDE